MRVVKDLLVLPREEVGSPPLEKLRTKGPRIWSSFRAGSALGSLPRKLSCDSEILLFP